MEFLSRLGQHLSNPNNADRLAGIGTALGALDRGQVADLSPYLGQIRGRAADAEAQAALEGSGALDMFTPQQRAFIATLPPAQANAVIQELMFAPPTPEATHVLGEGDTLVGADGRTIATGIVEPERRRTVVINGVLIDEDTQEVLYSAPQGYRILTTEEALARGLDTSQSWQMEIATEDVENITGRTASDVTNVNVGAQESEFDKATGRFEAEQINGLVTQGQTANRNLVRLEELEGLLADAPQGAAGALNRFAAGLGIEVEGAGVVAAADAIISAMVPEQRQPGSGPMSDADLALFKRSLPSLANTPEGNVLIVRTLRAIAAYDVEMGRIAAAVQSGAMTMNEGREAMAAMANPIDGVRGASGGAAASGGSTPTRRVYNPETGGFD